MRFGEALNEWFKVLGRRWKPLLLTSLIAFTPVAVGVALVFALVEGEDRFDILADPEALEALPADALVDLLAPLLWVFLTWGILQTLGSVFVYLTASRTVALDRNGLPGGTAEVLSASMRRFPAALIAVVLISVAGLLAVGAIFGLGWLVIGSLGSEFAGVFVTTVIALTGLVIIIWLSVAVSLYPQVLTMEDLGPTEAIARSFRLVRRRWWLTLGFALVTGLLVGVIAQLLSIVLTPLFLISAFAPAMFGVAFGLSVWLGGPAVAAIGAAYALWYVNLRADEETLTPDQLV